MSIESLIAAWDGEQVLVRHDAESGAWIFVCIHSRLLGPAGGGTRMKVYPSPQDGLRDALRLARGMTLKLAAADMPFGGGKAVIAVPSIPEGPARAGLLRRYAAMIASLGGSFQTGPDMNTSSQDMDLIAEHCPHVFCRSEALGGSGDPGPHTARGVHHGIRAAVAHALGTDGLHGRSVLVQGVGSVGRALAELLAADGARVLVSDVDARRAGEVAAGVGGEVVPPEAAIGTACDVFAPCALGGVVHAAAIPRLRCRIVAGSANNQLAEPEDAERLRRAGILYAPDYVINAGGALNAIGIETLGWTREAVDARIAGLGAVLAEIFARSDAEGISTDRAAEAVAERRLSAAAAG
jgi:leucine dehydrogenase